MTEPNPSLNLGDQTLRRRELDAHIEQVRKNMRDMMYDTGRAEAYAYIPYTNADHHSHSENAVYGMMAHTEGAKPLLSEIDLVVPVWKLEKDPTLIEYLIQKQFCHIGVIHNHFADIFGLVHWPSKHKKDAKIFSPNGIVPISKEEADILEKQWRENTPSLSQSKEKRRAYYQWMEQNILLERAKPTLFDIQPLSVN